MGEAQRTASAVKDLRSPGGTVMPRRNRAALGKGTRKRGNSIPLPREPRRPRNYNKVYAGHPYPDSPYGAHKRASRPHRGDA